MTKSAIQAASELLLPSIRKAVARDDVPVDAGVDASKVVAAVTKEVAPILVHETNSEPWYQSRVTWGAIISVVAGILGTFGIVVDDGLRADMINLVLALIPVLGGAISLYGRWRAKKPIGSLMMDQNIPFAGPGLWIRIRHRFGPRLPEWALAYITTVWGAVLLLPYETFAGDSWTVFRALGSEAWWGTMMVFWGLLRLTGLIINGARKNVTPWIRAVSAGFGFIIFLTIALCYALSGVVSTWLAIYPTFALLELANVYRATRDAGEGNA